MHMGGTLLISVVHLILWARDIVINFIMSFFLL